MLGFVESFTASYCCRICSAKKEEMQSMLYQCDNLLRTNANYEQDCLLSGPKATGIKEKCIFVGNLNRFDLFENVAVDLLHDFLESTCRYVMTYIVNF